MITVCIVEDEIRIRKTLADILGSSEGISCAGVFSDAETLLERFDDIQPDITLIDLDLPGISGIDAIFKLKSAYPRSKFLVLTIFSNEEKIFKALKAGAGGYLLKKDSFARLADEIKMLYHNGAPMSPEIARKVIAYFQQYVEKREFDDLTEKERRVLDLIVEGFLYKEVAHKLNVTIDTIKKHSHNIYEKLHVRNRSEAIRKYLSK